MLQCLLQSFSRVVQSGLHGTHRDTQNPGRRLRRQTTLLVLAGMLCLLCLFLTAGLLYPVYPTLTLACLAYLCAAVTGACILTVVFMQKRRELTC